MTPQYRIINQCLQLLNQSEIPDLYQLRVEIQLIQLKRLLLDEHRPVWACSEETLHEVLCEFRKIRDGECAVDAVSDLIKRLGSIIAEFSTCESLIELPQ